MLTPNDVTIIVKGKPTVCTDSMLIRIGTVTPHMEVYMTNREGQSKIYTITHLDYDKETNHLELHCTEPKPL